MTGVGLAPIDSARPGNTPGKSITYGSIDAAQNAKPVPRTAVGSERTARDWSKSSNAVIAAVAIVAACSIAKSGYDTPTSMFATGVRISATRTKARP